MDALANRYFVPICPIDPGTGKRNSRAIGLLFRRIVVEQRKRWTRSCRLLPRFAAVSVARFQLASNNDLDRLRQLLMRRDEFDWVRRMGVSCTRHHFERPRSAQTTAWLRANVLRLFGWIEGCRWIEILSISTREDKTNEAKEKLGAEKGAIETRKTPFSLFPFAESTGSKGGLRIFLVWRPCDVSFQPISHSCRSRLIARPNT